MIYLASPYNDSDSNVRQRRFEQVAAFAAKMVQSGYPVLSPICHWHPIAEAHDLPKDYEFWLKVNMALLSKCDQIWVLMLDGWRESRGVKAEVNYAFEHKIRISYFQPL